MNLAIASVAFTEGNKWRLSDGSSTFHATIADEGFLARVDRGEERFGKGDILRVELHMTQSRGDVGLTTTYVVEHVIDHIPTVRPVSLFDHEPDGDVAEEDGGT
jgi:hypothetical protein